MRHRPATGRFIIGGSQAGTFDANRWAFGAGIYPLGVTDTDPGASIIRALRFAAGDGLVGAPAFYFAGDADNGAYYITTNDWGLAAGGVLSLELTTSGAVIPNTINLRWKNAAGTAVTVFNYYSDNEFYFDNPTSAKGIIFRTGGTTQRLYLDGSGNLVMGTGALGTTATDGFIYAPSSAGAPTGVPTAYTGRVPVEIDTTNGRIYAYYGSAWHYWNATA